LVVDESGGLEMRHVAFAAMIALSVCACTVSMNSDDFKKEASGTSTGVSERFTVELPFDRVMANLKGPVDACLNFNTGALYSSHGTVAPGKLVRTQITTSQPGHAKIVSQNKLTGTIVLNPEPEGGFYIFVADITSVSKSKTDIEMYYHKLFFNNTFAESIKKWASGEDKSCHDGLF
jgi:hypothetical protein